VPGNSVQGFLSEDEHYQKRAKSFYTKQHSNPSGLIVFSYGENINIDILQRFQSVKAPWYIDNYRILEDLQINILFSEIKKWSAKYIGKLEDPLMH
jgi:predicted nucleotidyltransferase component of viral defense system